MKTNYNFALLFGVTQNSIYAFNEVLNIKICPLLRIAGHFFCTRPKHNQYSLLGGCLRGFRPLSYKTLKFTLKSVDDVTLSLRCQNFIIQLIREARWVLLYCRWQVVTPSLTILFPIYSKSKADVY